MQTVPYLDLRAQYRPLRSEIMSALEEVCESTSFAQGPATSKFEGEFAEYCGVDHCVSLNSGTSALMRRRQFEKEHDAKTDEGERVGWGWRTDTLL